MTSQRIFLSLLGGYALAHFLLAQPNLNPELRAALQTVENKDLTRLISAFLAA